MYKVVINTDDCAKTGHIHNSNSQGPRLFFIMYLSKSSPPDNFERLKVIQAESRPLQSQELSLLTGVLWAPHYFLHEKDKKIVREYILK